MLSVRNLAVEVGGRLTLEGATFEVHAGDKVGLVGRNGAGKTSLLKVLGGEEEPYRGTVKIVGRLGFLTQDPRKLASHDAPEAVSYVVGGRGLDELAERMDKLTRQMDEDPSDQVIARFSRAEEAYAAAGGYSADADARSILAGLGLEASRADLPLSVLSGGERRRVELARILFAGSDLLLLDEPTNHLDIDARTWLLNFLRDYPGALLVVSHDLELLDESITRVIHLDEGKIVEYKGTYSQYRKARADDEARLTKLVSHQQAEIKRLADLAESMRHQTAKRARTAKSLDKRVARLKSAAAEGPGKGDHKYRVRFPAPPHCGRVVLDATGLAQAYGGPPVFEDVSFGLERGERLLIMGLNGAGKTSLLRILAGQAEPKAGSFELGLGVKPGYYAQEHEGIEAGVSVLDHMRRLSREPEADLRGLLGMFGLSGEIAFQDASTLSGGEKTKLALAQLVAGGHNLLLLDEPTNNLDPPSREAIGRALADWPGAMILVSHDVGFVTELSPARALLMPDGTEDIWSDDLIELVAMA